MTFNIEKLMAALPGYKYEKTADGYSIKKEGALVKVSAKLSEDGQLIRDDVDFDATIIGWIVMILFGWVILGLIIYALYVLISKPSEKTKIKSALQQAQI